MVKFRKFEKKIRCEETAGWCCRTENDLMKCRTDLLDRRASVLNLAKALEQRGGSLCRVDALRLRADALGRWADEYLRRAKACEGRVKALSERARAYNQRVKTFEGLHAFNGITDLEYEKILILNEFVVKFSLTYEVKENGEKVVDKKLLVSLKGELYFVDFIVKTEEDDVEPYVIFG
ncbi:hypothetical protein Tco_1425634 [Tanacetum coccineum]